LTRPILKYTLFIKVGKNGFLWVNIWSVGTTFPDDSCVYLYIIYTYNILTCPLLLSYLCACVNVCVHTKYWHAVRDITHIIRTMTYTARLFFTAYTHHSRYLEKRFRTFTLWNFLIVLRFLFTICLRLQYFKVPRHFASVPIARLTVNVFKFKRTPYPRIV